MGVSMTSSQALGSLGLQVHSAKHTVRLLEKTMTRFGEQQRLVHVMGDELMVLRPPYLQELELQPFLVNASSAPRGSSMSNTDGLAASVRAIATRRRMPPEIRLTWKFAQRSEPDEFEVPMCDASFSASLTSAPVSRSKRMLPSTVSHGNDE